MNTPNPVPPPPSPHDWKKPTLWIIVVTILIAILYFLTIGRAEAATKEPPIRNTYYWVMSGSGAKIEESPDQATCDRRAEEIGRAGGETRTSGGNVTTCRHQTNYIWSYIPGTTPPPVCGPVQNSPKTMACPAGTTGTWTQTGTMGPPPACTVTWSPTSPPAGACTTPPPPVLPAPTNLATSNPSALVIRTVWDTVPERGSYELESCRGTTCTTFTRLACLTANAYNQTLPVNATARYRVRASRASDCSNPGPFSAIVAGNTIAPEPPVTGADLSWTAPTRNTDGSTLTNLAGYRVNYGTSAGAMTSTVQVASPTATRFTVPNLAPGTYYFAVRAYTSGGTESAQSNVVTKIIR